MDRRRRSHWLLDVALVLLITFSVYMASRLVCLASSASLESAQASSPSFGPSQDLRRRPRVKLTGWVHVGKDGEWQVGEQVVRIDPDSPLVSQIRPNRYVTVIARMDDDGRLHAERIAPQMPEAGPSLYTMEFRCLIQEVEPRYWIVCNRVVLVTENTSVEGRPEIGALAEVKGIRLTGDTVVARSIRVVVAGAFAEVEFEGPIESTAQDRWIVNGILVTISPVTTIRGTPELGLVAEVRGLLQPDDSVLAQLITVKGPGLTSQVDIAGLVEKIESTHWVVGGTTVFVDRQTFIDDSRAPAQVGMWAQVRALRRQDQSLLALRIRLSRPG